MEVCDVACVMATGCQSRRATALHPPSPASSVPRLDSTTTTVIRIYFSFVSLTSNSYMGDYYKLTLCKPNCYQITMLRYWVVSCLFQLVMDRFDDARAHFQAHHLHVHYRHLQLYINLNSLDSDLQSRK